MPASVSFRRWFGSFFLSHKPAAERFLTLTEVREDCFDVIVKFRRQLLANSMDFRDDPDFKRLVFDEYHSGAISAPEAGEAREALLARC